MIVRSVPGDNLFVYVSTTEWLRLQQEAEWANIRFERRNPNSPQKSHPPDDFGKIFTRNYKIRSGVTNFASKRNFEQTFVYEISFKKSNACFLWRFNYRRRRLNSNYRIGYNNRDYDERKQDIFLASGDALVYLAKPVHKKYSTKLFWGNPFSTYVSYGQFFNSPPPVRTCTHFWWPPPIPQVVYLRNGWLISQPKNK